jgi:hypothetical protein
MAATHVPAMSQQGQALSAEDVVARPASFMRGDEVAVIAFAAATGERTSPVLTRAARINLMIGMRFIACVLSTCASPT